MDITYAQHTDIGEREESVEFLKSNIEMIDKNCYEYLKENTCMTL